MNEKLGRFHFGANMLAVFLFLAFPLFFNLSFHSQPGESRLDRFFRAFGASLDSYAWGIGALLIVQVLFLGNLLWSIFKGQKVIRPTTTGSTAASGEIFPTNQAEASVPTSERCLGVPLVIILDVVNTRDELVYVPLHSLVVTFGSSFALPSEFFWFEVYRSSHAGRNFERTDFVRRTGP